MDYDSTDKLLNHPNFTNAEKYLDYLHYQRLLSPQTVFSYIYYIDAFLKFLDKNINEATEKDIGDFVKYVRLRNLKNSSIQSYLAALKSYYSYAKKTDLLFFLTNTIRVKKERSVVHFPTFKEIEELRKTMREHKLRIDPIKCKKLYGKLLRDVALLEMFIATGARSREIRTLKFADINVSNRTVLIHGKGGHQRFSIFGEKAFISVFEHIQFNAIPNEDYLFEMCGGQLVNYIIKRWCKRANINSRLHAHSFRHSHVTEAHRRGVDMQAISDQVGHFSLNTTRHYTHLDLEFRKEQYLKFDI